MTATGDELDKLASTTLDGKVCASRNDDDHAHQHHHHHHHHHHHTLKYLPNPQPWKRGCPGNAEFFTSNPECYRDRGFFSYGQFWQAHQPIISQKPTMQTVSSSFWPFGQRITCLTGSERKEDIYSLDSRIIARAAPGMPRSHSMPTKQMPAYERGLRDKLLNEQEFGIKTNVKREVLGPNKRFQEVDFLAPESHTQPDRIIEGTRGARGEFHGVEELFRRPGGRGSTSAQSSRSRSSTSSGRNLFTR